MPSARVSVVRSKAPFIDEHSALLYSAVYAASFYWYFAVSVVREMSAAGFWVFSIKPTHSH